jgi:hypothetical protein
VSRAKRIVRAGFAGSGSSAMIFAANAPGSARITKSRLASSRGRHRGARKTSSFRIGGYEFKKKGSAPGFSARWSADDEADLVLLEDALDERAAAELRAHVPEVHKLDLARRGAVGGEGIRAVGGFTHGAARS